MKKKYISIIFIILLLVMLDQISKLLVVNYLQNEIIFIDNFFSFTFIKNYGAAFGIFGGNTMLLILITILLVLYLSYDTYKNINKKINVIFNILIIAGALGNLIDRIFRHYVVDFISFILFNNQMPVFNIADILVTFGVIGLIFTIFKEERV
jgi:signal peptidase II